MNYFISTHLNFSLQMPKYPYIEIKYIKECWLTSLRKEENIYWSFVKKKTGYSWTQCSYTVELSICENTRFQIEGWMKKQICSYGLIQAITGSPLQMVGVSAASRWLTFLPKTYCRHLQENMTKTNTVVQDKYTRFIIRQGKKVTNK